MSKPNVFTLTPTKEQLISIRKDVKCTEQGCEKVFPHMGSLKLHLVKSHGQIKNDADKRLYHRGNGKPKPDCELEFKCPEEKCRYSTGKDQHFTTFRLLKQHYMKIHAEKVYECSKCEQGYSRESDLKRHEPKCGRLYGCGTCPVQYTTTEALLTHCKRQEHVYPEEYRRVKVEKKSKCGKPANKISTIALVPVVVMVPTPPPPPLQAAPMPTLVQPIKPRPPPPTLLKYGKAPEEDDMIHTSNRTSPADVPSFTTNGPITDYNAITDDDSVVRQDVVIQTDIFGVDSLSVSGRYNNYSNYSNLPIVSQKKCTASVGTFQSPPKKSLALKRKLGVDKYTNPSSPRRKKMKSTTGIQTSMSWTKKPGNHVICGTQTTGDYILKTAMAQANIQIERKTVASQVTPQKRNQVLDQHSEKCTIETQTFSHVDKENPVAGGYTAHKPVLVDSYSQVQQRNIWAETSHNLAESQTMTDIPPSISTQTLQSYLENQQERKKTKTMKQRSREKGVCNRTEIGWGSSAVSRGTPANVSSSVNTSTIHTSTIQFDAQTDANISAHPSITDSDLDRNNTVEIYDSSLTSSVSFVAPKKVRGKRSVGSRYMKNQGTDLTQPLRHPRIPSSHQIQTSTASEIQESISRNLLTAEIMTTLLPNAQQIKSKEQSLTLEGSYLGESPHRLGCIDSVMSNSYIDKTNRYMDKAGSYVTDTDTQAMMSADDFESLLQSSGIFLSNGSKFEGKPKNNRNLSTQTSTVDAQIDTSFDFLTCDVDTVDVNTQTGGDVSLFPDYGSIDTNTQTGSEMDLLDLVMTNMETQTLNEADLIDLGLSSLNANTATQTMGIGTSDFDVSNFDWTDPHPSTSTQFCSTGTETADFDFQSPVKPFNDTDQILSLNQSNLADKHDNQSGAYNLLYNLDDRAPSSKIETHTMGVDPMVPSTSRIETHTMGVDPMIPSSSQIETHTMGVDPMEPLTDLETINMETQTTLEDLQQLSDWFD